MGFRRAVKALAAEIGLGRVEAVTIHDQPEKSLDGRVALVTGGTSGIGLAIAERLCKAGCSTVVVGTNREHGLMALSRLGEGGHFVQADVSSESGAQQALDGAKDALSGKGPDILVNSAGRNGRLRFPDVTADEFDRIVNVNLRGLLLVSQVVAKDMIARSVRGNILNVSSVSSFRPASGPYEISKWGVRGLTLGIADELIKYGIVVNAIAPGPTATPMMGRTEGDDLTLGWNPSGRMADAREIAELAAVLVSDAGRLVVGDTLCASGGGGVITLHR